MKKTYLLLFIIFLSGCVTAPAVILPPAPPSITVESNKAKLDPDAIVTEWKFTGSAIRGPGFGQLDWCPKKQFFMITNYYENPDRNGFPQEVTIILNLERRRPEYITWEEDDLIWVFERFCQEKWVQRYPNKDYGI